MKNNASPLTVTTGNYYNKHETTNYLYRLLVNRYKSTLQNLVKHLPGTNGFEIGSGEGYIVDYINEVRPDLQLMGSDISLDLIRKTAADHLDSGWLITLGEALPFSNRSFDIVFACEVLEHVYQPEEVLKEIQRITDGYLVISVPQEPIWRILNMLRFKYVRDFGNTPGHVNHWSVNGITQLIGKYFQVEQVKVAFPWSFVVAKQR